MHNFVTCTGLLPRTASLKEGLKRVCIVLLGYTAEIVHGDSRGGAYFILICMFRRRASAFPGRRVVLARTALTGRIQEIGE